MKRWPGHERALVPTAAMIVVAAATSASGQPRQSPIQAGWARNCVNAVIIRNQAVVTHGDEQYTAFYDADSRMVLARRKLGSDDWETRVTRYTGNTGDAHNAITLGIDGDGFLHLCWDHHNHPLRYARSVAPGSLELTDKLAMTGSHESKLCYPEFFHLDNGDLLFMYRDGVSGNGNTLVNRYDVSAKRWLPVQHPLIDGQGQRNAYPNQIAVGPDGTWHLSWNWREQGGVQTNHDLCYARSRDEGRTWETSEGKPYSLPITVENSEVIVAISQDCELINHTTMTTDAGGRPLIATYWRPEGTEVPQYHVVWHDGRSWIVSQVGERTSPFRLSGGGTKRIPISRPKLAVDRDNRVYMIFRDSERGDRVSVAVCDRIGQTPWRHVDLTHEPVGMWEPNFDPILWRRDNVLHLFLQHVGQGDGEKLEDLAPQMVSILEWQPR